MSEACNQRLKGCRVLVIEDGRRMAQEIGSALRENGAEQIGPVAELSDVMRLVDDDGFDVAVIDVSLHAQLAYAVADELARQRIPFAFVTGGEVETIPPRYPDVARWMKPVEPAMIVDDLVPLCEQAAKKLVPIDPKG